MDPDVSFLVAPSGFYLFKELMQAFCVSSLGVDRALAPAVLADQKPAAVLVGEMWAPLGTRSLGTKCRGPSLKQARGN